MKIPPLEFVQHSEESPITEAEIFERFTSPNAISRNLFDLLAAWEAKARRVLAEHGIRPGMGLLTTWPANVKAAPPEVKDAWRVLMASGELRKALHAKEPHELFGLAMAGIQLGLAIMEAHTRPYTDPAAVGIAVKDGGVEASKQKHGTAEEREARYAAMRQRYGELRAEHFEHPDWGHYKITDQIGEEFGMTGRRVREHVPNTVSPRKPRKKV